MKILFFIYFFFIYQISLWEHFNFYLFRLYKKKGYTSRPFANDNDKNVETMTWLKLQNGSSTFYTYIYIDSVFFKKKKYFFLLLSI